MERSVNRQQQKKIGKNLQLKIDSGWRVEAGPTRKYVLMKKPQPDPIQPEFGPWGLNPNQLNPFFIPKTGSTQKIVSGLAALVWTNPDFPHTYVPPGLNYIL